MVTKREVETIEEIVSRMSERQLFGFCRLVEQRWGWAVMGLCAAVSPKNETTQSEIDRRREIYTVVAGLRVNAHD
jgi:hypothetical protein